MDKQDISTAKHCKYEFLNSGYINRIRQEIIGDTEYINDNNLVNLLYDEGPELLNKIYWINTDDSFFNTILPSVEGHTKKIDQDLKDEL